MKSWAALILALGLVSLCAGCTLILSASQISPALDRAATAGASLLADLVVGLRLLGSLIILGGLLYGGLLLADRYARYRDSIALRQAQIEEQRQRNNRLAAEAHALRTKALRDLVIEVAASSQVVLIEGQVPLNLLRAEGDLKEIVALSHPHSQTAPLVAKADEDENEPSAPANPPPHLLDVFSQVQQVYALIGGQRVGKTFQARHVLAQWQRRGAETWVIGPKWDQGEWRNCRMFGGGDDFDQVQAGLDALRAMAKTRHEDTSRRHEDHPVLVVVLDDWTPIVRECPLAATFVTSATTLFASVNIVLIFIAHLDTANGWGVGHVGSSLTHNFIKVFLIPAYDTGGRLQREGVRAEMLLPGQAERQAITLAKHEVSWPAQPDASWPAYDQIPSYKSHISPHTPIHTPPDTYPDGAAPWRVPWKSTQLDLSHFDQPAAKAAYDQNQRLQDVIDQLDIVGSQEKRLFIAKTLVNGTYKR